MKKLLLLLVFLLGCAPTYHTEKCGILPWVEHGAKGSVYHYYEEYDCQVIDK
jgi:hypothetical protein